jgi:hypothetical protein
MLETHDLLPVSWQLMVPREVSSRLVDLGTACNRAALAVEQACLHQRYAAEEIDSASASRESAPYRTEFARQWSDCAVSYTDQLTSVYTVTAATFVAYAAPIAADYAARRTFALTEPRLTLPSHLLGAPDTCIPLVQMPARCGPRHAVAKHNTELAASHHGLMGLVEHTVRSHPLDAYDVPSRAANRPAMSVDLGVDLARGMHAYAANCTWALGLVTRADDQPDQRRAAAR